jgi:phospholipase C
MVGTRLVHPRLVHPRPLLLSSAVLALISLMLGLNACSSSSSSPAPPPPPPTPSYSLAAAALTPASITAGAASTAAITVTPANGYTGSVTLSCAKLTGSGAVPICAFSPNPVPISGANAGASTLTVSTTINTAGGTYAISVTGSDAASLAPSNGAQALSLMMTAVIQHIVIIFQENRTPDNLFHDQTLKNNGADISFTGNSFGTTIPLSPIDLGTAGTNPQNYDLSHANSAFVEMYDGGKMDGASLIKCSPAAGVTCPANAQFMYVKPADVAPYFALAEQYTFGDRMFQTNEGPSFPAHQFIISGTSAPTATSPLFAAENPAEPAGCLAVLTETVPMIDATGSETNSPPEYPCFEHPTLTDFLDTAGITWRYYAPSAGSIWTGPDAIDHICQPQTINSVITCTGPDWTNNVIIPEWQVLEDISNGQLPQVSWIIPDGAHSDHAASNNGTGPSWVASIVNAIGTSQYWNNTAIIITWDDWGGWYDHVAPKVINDGVSWGSGYVYGFRVPLIVVSPYAKAATIDHTTHDFGSVLKFIETTFSLPSLNYADAPADDLSSCFVLTQTPITFQSIPAPLDAAFFINDKSPRTDPDDD